MNEYTLLYNTCKEYKTKKMGRHLAVDRMNLGVPKGEVLI